MIPVGIFAKPPLPGLVQTRLIVDLGSDKATRIYRHCLEHTLDVAQRSGLEYQAYLSQEFDGEPFQDEQYSLQRGDDLGARMINALRDLLGNGAPAAIIVGSDCLDLETHHLQQAAQALADHELVLAPALDGGFALIGCRLADPRLFHAVTWSSPGVLEQTLDNARRLGYRSSLLETLRDIDTLQDVEQYPELLAMVASS